MRDASERSQPSPGPAGHSGETAAPTLPQLAYIVSHTHWDREWYLPFQAFRVNLGRVVRAVLDALENDPAYEHFVLDGQSILLTDHLAVQPEDTDRIRTLVQNGKLAVGPWYVLPDLFLVSGEATVRNLLLGHQDAGAFGPAQKIGYLPDSFGHIAQLPQILRQAGIDSFIYTRGNGDEIDRLGWEHIWRAPDGSEVLAVNICGGYCNAGGLGYEELWHAHTRRELDPALAVAKVRDLLEKYTERANGGVALLCNGCDHLPPQRDLARIISALRASIPTTEFLHGSFDDYLAAVRASGCATEIWEGELRHGKLHPILSGVWSARMPLKQQNDTCQTLLADIWEPVATACHFLHGQDYPAGALGAAWRLLLQNHPHDSICGCSTDPVHREMQVRFASVKQIAEQSLRHHLEHLAPTFARNAVADRNTAICVMNPLAERRTEVVTRLVVLQPHKYDLQRLRLLDTAGRAIPFRILATRYLERFWGVDYRTDLDGRHQQKQLQTYLDSFEKRLVRNESERGEADCFLTIQFLAEDLPPLGHTTYYLTDRHSNLSLPPQATGVRVTANTLENDYYLVHLHADGKLDIKDKTSGKIYDHLNCLVSTAEVGDEYDYCPAPEQIPCSSHGAQGKIRLVEDAGFSGTLEACFSLPLPERIAQDRRRRSDHLVSCQARIRVSLSQGSRFVEIETVFDNRAQDHRLRAVFPTRIGTETLVSDGHFYLNRRTASSPGGKDWVQPPVPTRLQQEYSLVQDGQQGLALLCRGLPEIELTSDEAGEAVLNLTLLRAVGWLSRDDLSTRQFASAGPTLPTPEAQCPGQHVFRYALVAYSGDDLQAGIKSISRRYRVPPLVIQGVADQHVAGGRGLLEKSSPLTAVSAIKRHEERDTLVLRLYNLAGQEVNEKLTFEPWVIAAWYTDLLEDRIQALAPTDDNALELNLRPHEIVTLEIEFADRSVGS